MSTVTERIAAQQGVVVTDEQVAGVLADVATKLSNVAASAQASRLAACADSPTSFLLGFAACIDLVQVSVADVRLRGGEG